LTADPGNLALRRTETFEKWYRGLRDLRAAARIDVHIRRVELGNPGDVRAGGL